MLYMQPEWLQKMKVDRGAAHPKQESRSWSEGLSGGLDGDAARNSGWSPSRGREKDFAEVREKEMAAVLDLVEAG
jgi:hypothetical protein